MAKAKKSKLKIIPLGGVDGIGRNITVFECGEDIIVVDCGISFAEVDTPGIDFVIPDISYLEGCMEKVRGIFITHGHEDHIGAIPFFLKRINVPVYATRLTLGILENKLIEHNMRDVCELVEVAAGDVVEDGNFAVEFIHVNHSIADSCALHIYTPAGNALVTGDFKIDLTPIDGETMDLARFAEIGSEGLDVLLCDSTNVERVGFTQSEKIVGAFLERIMFNTDKRIIIATFSSNVHRVQQIIDASAKFGRKVVITGRSMLNVINAASRLGYMTIPEGILIEVGDMKRYNMDQITIITTGSQGEPMSALYRMAYGEHAQIKLGKDDLVVLSSSPIPGNEKLICNITNELLKRGATVLNDDAVSDVHVSGHASREELKIMHRLTQPEYFIPIHGEYKHLIRHMELAKELGMDEENIFIPEQGHIIELSPSGMKKRGNVPNGVLYVDGAGFGDLGSGVLKERMKLSEDGVVIITVTLDSEFNSILSGPETISRGFAYVGEAEEITEQLNGLAAEVIEKCLDKGYCDFSTIKSKIRGEISGFIFKQTKRRPMVIPIIMSVAL
ncbi:MAG: ribonuclease J [Ruminococcaceae bacterium]|nr:ribonuclease J [Oscillospiraceae bacterium]